MALHFNDGINFLRKLSIAKLWNGVKVLSSYWVAKYTGRPVQWGMPFTVSFEPTTFCNLRCPECPSGLRAFSRPTGMLRKDFFRDTLAELQRELVYLYFYFQGEPYLNPDFLDMVAYASAKNIYTVTSTNAHFLTDQNAKRTVEAGLDRLIISVDGTTQDTYEQYRIGGQLSKVLAGTKRLVAWKEALGSHRPHIIFQYLVVQPNEHQIEAVQTLAKDLGVDAVSFKTAQVYDYKYGHQLIPTIDKYSRYKKNSDGTYSIKNKLLNHCWKLWHSCVITWDGKVVPCCFDKDAQHQLGNLQTHSFKTLWQGDLYNNFRKKVLKSRKEIDICANCSEGTKVWA